MNGKKEQGKITYRIDSKGWVRVCEQHKDKILIRANRFGKPHKVPDTHKDKSQQLDAEGFVRIRPKRTWDF